MKHHAGSAAAGIVLLSILVTAGSQATAQSPVDPAVDFVVTPSRLEIRAEPGDSLQVPIRVYNEADEALVLDAYIENIEVPRSELIQPDDLAFTASQWLRFDSDVLEIGGGGDQLVTIRADVPLGAPTGGYHAFGFIQSRPPPGSLGLQPSARVGVTVLVEVAPDDTDLDRSARVSDSGLRVRWNGWFDADVIAHTVVDNTGEAHVVTGGVHTYRSWPGSGSLEAEIGPDTTLRGTRHTFETSWDAVPLFGKVTVTSELVYQAGPDDLPVIVTQHTVWIIPWRLLGIGAVALVIAGFVHKRRTAAKQPSPQRAEHDEEQTQPEEQTV
jgi:hypothetical protein